MPKTTEPQAPPAEILAKLKQIENIDPYHCRDAVIRSNVTPVDGVWFVYRSRYNDSEWHLTQVLKADTRGIVKTSSGVNFSPNGSKTYLATKRIGENYSLPELYSIDGIIECHQKKLLKDAEFQRERDLQNLKNKISCLNAHKDTELIQALLEILKSHGVN